MGRMQRTAAAILAGTGLVVIAGCESPPDSRPPSETRRVGETQTLETRRLNQRDLEEFATELSLSLIESSRLAPFDDSGPPVVYVSKFVNEGGRGTMHIDRYRLFQRVLDALNRSGTAFTYVEDDPAIEAARRDAAAQGRPFPGPDYTIVLRLYEDTVSVGNITQFQYLLQMQVTAIRGPRPGLMVWSEEREIAKQAPRGASIGF
jgi:PBP1b-binding outer membrane lipoprotein LpoB